MSNFNRNEMLETFELARRLYYGGLPAAVRKKYAQRICELVEGHAGQLTPCPVELWKSYHDARGWIDVEVHV